MNLPAMGSAESRSYPSPNERNSNHRVCAWLNTTALGKKKSGMVPPGESILWIDATTQMIAAKPEAVQREPLNSGALTYA